MVLLISRKNIRKHHLFLSWIFIPSVEFLWPLELPAVEGERGRLGASQLEVLGRAAEARRIGSILEFVPKSHGGEWDAGDHTI
jgi:hypothetical protein